MSARTEIAAAVSEVEGFTCHPYFVQDTDPGSTYVRLERIDYPNPFGGLAFWNVVVVVPQDQAEAEQYIETNLPVLLEAIGPHLAITSAQPQRLQLDGVGVLLTLFINGHREADS